jgi:hypothetical protein
VSVYKPQWVCLTFNFDSLCGLDTFGTLLSVNRPDGWLLRIYAALDYSLRDGLIKDDFLQRDALLTEVKP